MITIESMKLKAAALADELKQARAAVDAARDKDGDAAKVGTDVMHAEATASVVANRLAKTQQAITDMNAAAVQKQLDAVAADKAAAEGSLAKKTDTIEKWLVEHFGDSHLTAWLRTPGRISTPTGNNQNERWTLPEIELREEIARLNSAAGKLSRELAKVREGK